MLRSFFGQQKEQQSQNKIIAQYIWIDGSSVKLRSKTRVLFQNSVQNISQIPYWSFDGSSTQQATTNNSELVLKPEFFCKDPFRNDESILILCSTWKWQTSQLQVNSKELRDILVPTETNFRSSAEDFWTEYQEEQFQFGIEQEYLMIQNQPSSIDTDISMQQSQINYENGPHYCSQGSHMNLGTQLSKAHLNYCLKAGLNICGVNSEVLQDQWEYQIGVCEGLNVADQLWMSRYILIRTAEMFEIDINFDPKPFTNQNGQGAHVNVSNRTTRSQTNEMNYSSTEQALKGLSNTHQEYIPLFGIGNEKRLTGLHETSSFDTFSSGIGNRSCSVRIITNNINTNRVFAGYIEDRRPASNMDPYVVCTLIASSIIGEKSNHLVQNIVKKYSNFLKGNKDIGLIDNQSSRIPDFIDVFLESIPN